MCQVGYVDCLSRPGALRAGGGAARRAPPRRLRCAAAGRQPAQGAAGAPLRLFLERPAVGFGRFIALSTSQVVVPAHPVTATAADTHTLQRPGHRRVGCPSTAPGVHRAAADLLSAAAWPKAILTHKRVASVACHSPWAPATSGLCCKTSGHSCMMRLPCAAEPPGRRPDGPVLPRADRAGGAPLPGQ